MKQKEKKERMKKGGGRSYLKETENMKQFTVNFSLSDNINLFP